MYVTQKNAVKKKLMAATAMLLIACIMVISSSYAWFTLSTKPEITGITTTVGANGNLEIALADTTVATDGTDATWDDPDTNVYSNVGSSMSVTDKTTANKTWGNLVDLSEGYGLNGVTLYPSRLSVSGNETDGYVLQDNPLKVPSYGDDGRVAELKASTLFAKYDTVEEAYFETVARGVRAIGTVSGMTDRQLTYRQAKSALASAKVSARTEANRSLTADADGNGTTNGSDLANIIIKKALTESGDPTYTPNDLTALQAIVDGLQLSQSYLMEGWEQYVLGYAASATNMLTIADSDVKALSAALEKHTAAAPTYTVNTTAKTLTITAEAKTFNLTEDMVAYYSEITGVATTLTSVESAITTAINSSDYSWATIRGILQKLVDPDKVFLNGELASTFSKSDVGKLASAALGGDGIQIQMPVDSGVYSVIAEYSSDYSATVYLTNIQYGDVSLDQDIPATMITVTEKGITYVTTEDNPDTTDVNEEVTTTTESHVPYFTTAGTTLTGYGAPTGDTTAGTASSVSDTYGYAIDFFLRTNASSSNLLLQSKGAQRVYEDSASETTMGGGSCMTFTTTAEGFEQADMLKLMGAIRVVLLDGEGTIVGVAALNTSDYETENLDGKSYVKAYLELQNYNFVADANGYVLKVTGAKKTSENKLDTTIMALQKNKAVKLTALVYLDGNIVDNSYVAANALASLTGKMNLQFASDAELQPMENADLRNGQLDTTP